MNAPKTPCCKQTMRDDISYFFSFLTQEERNEVLRRMTERRQKLIDGIDAALGIAGAVLGDDPPPGNEDGR